MYCKTCCSTSLKLNPVIQKTVDLQLQKSVSPSQLVYWLTDWAVLIGLYRCHLWVQYPVLIIHPWWKATFADSQSSPGNSCHAVNTNWIVLNRYIYAHSISLQFHSHSPVKLSCFGRAYTEHFNTAVPTTTVCFLSLLWDTSTTWLHVNEPFSAQDVFLIWFV